MLGLKLFTTSPKRRRARRPGSPDIESLLAVACERKVGALMTMESLPFRYKTLLVGFEPAKGVFHADALFPRSAERKLVAGETEIDFSFEVNDVKYRFTARFAGAGAWEGFDALTFALPTDVDESQRRGFYRVAPRIAEPVKLFTGPDLSEATTALDLSAGGISFRVSRDVAAEARFQGIVVLPDETVVETTLEVIDCHPLPGATSQPYRVRARYASLTPADRETIARYVMRRQREMIRTSLS